MFMTVNSKCAHPAVPTTGAQKSELRHSERDQGAAEDGIKSARTQAARPNMISPPPSWADADDLPKRSRERGLIGKTCPVRNLGE